MRHCFFIFLPKYGLKTNNKYRHFENSILEKYMKIYFKFKVLITKLTSVIVLFVFLPASAQNSALNFKVSEKQFKTLVVETIYQYSIQDYSPALDVVISEKQNQKSTPEAIVFEMLSSILKKDFQWNSSLWTKKSRSEMEQRDVSVGDTPSKWIERWRSFEGLSFRLMRRIEYSNYVLIEYEARRRDGTVSFKETMAMERQGSNWYLTQALEKDPILMNWDSKELRIKQLPNSWSPPTVSK